MRAIDPTCLRGNIYGSECFANQNGLCKILISTDFKGKKCPFYKNRQKYKEELKRKED